MIAFPFVRSRFANISPTFLISCEVQMILTILRYSEQYIRDHLSGTKVRICTGSEYDAVFDFSCIASNNLTKTFTSFCMSFLWYESDSELFKQSTCTFYASEILLFKFFINSWSWQVKCKLIGAFSLGFDIQWIHCQYL